MREWVTSIVTKPNAVGSKLLQGNRLSNPEDFVPVKFKPLNVHEHLLLCCPSAPRIRRETLDWNYARSFGPDGQKEHARYRTYSFHCERKLRVSGPANGASKQLHDYIKGSAIESISCGSVALAPIAQRRIPFPHLARYSKVSVRRKRHLHRQRERVPNN